MTIKQQIEIDIKSAMLAGDKTLTTTLRTIKGAALNIEVAKGIRDIGLPDEEYIALLSKEAKKRQESAEMYMAGGSEERADAEKAEIKIIEKYLPDQLTNSELREIVNTVLSKFADVNMGKMGQIIAEVKKVAEGQADSARIAAVVKESLA